MKVFKIVGIVAEEKDYDLGTVYGYFRMYLQWPLMVRLQI
jgi:hypothetical protein